MFVMIMLCSKTHATTENKKVLLEYYNIIKVVDIEDMQLQLTSEKKIIL